MSTKIPSPSPPKTTRGAPCGIWMRIRPKGRAIHSPAYWRFSIRFWRPSPVTSHRLHGCCCSSSESPLYSLAQLLVFLSLFASTEGIGCESGGRSALPLSMAQAARRRRPRRSARVVSEDGEEAETAAGAVATERRGAKERYQQSGTADDPAAAAKGRTETATPSSGPFRARESGEGVSKIATPTLRIAKRSAGARGGSGGGAVTQRSEVWEAAMGEAEGVARETVSPLRCAWPSRQRWPTLRA